MRDGALRVRVGTYGDSRPSSRSEADARWGTAWLRGDIRRQPSIEQERSGCETFTN
ncbi:MAG: hypothetical protein MR868_13690 [Lachnospiraceae bacterium]|nr:hypothetical protein [Lachnospiraceae bacterium]